MLREVCVCSQITNCRCEKGRNVINIVIYVALDIHLSQFCIQGCRPKLRKLENRLSRSCIFRDEKYSGRSFSASVLLLPMKRGYTSTNQDKAAGT